MRKCKNCQQPFTPKFSSLEKYCSDEDCRISYALEVVSKRKIAQEKKTKKEWGVEKAKMKEKLKTLSEWKQEFQIEINTIVRLIDNGYPCIATGTKNGKMNAGHYISVGSNDTLRFHLENIWIQSEHSNTWKSGDTIRYQNGLKETFGDEYFEYINSLQQIKPIKLTIDDIKEKIPIARGIIKWLKLQEKQFTNNERMFLRKRFNYELGIYN